MTPLAVLSSLHAPLKTRNARCAVGENGILHQSQPGSTFGGKVTFDLPKFNKIVMIIFMVIT